MNSLIEMVILNNNWVRRLNAFRNMHRSDPREGPSVSDDEEESPIPDLGSFMSIPQVMLHSPQPHPNLAQPLDVSGSNSIAIGTCPPALSLLPLFVPLVAEFSCR